MFDAQVVQTVSQESEKILDGNSIPNHIPPTHAQLSDTKTANQMPPRRFSTQFNKPLQPPGSKIMNNPNYNPDNRTLGPPYDPYYTSNQDNWASTNQNPQYPDPKSYSQNEKQNVRAMNPSVQQLPPSSYQHTNRHPSVQYQQPIDQFNQQKSNQNVPPMMNRNTRLDSVSRPPYNQGPPPQQWNPNHSGTKRPSLVAQAAYNVQDNIYTDNGPAPYGRNGYHSNVEHIENPLDQQPQTMSSESQSYRQNIESQAYRVDQQGYRQTTNQYHQIPPDNQGYRSQVAAEQDAINGARDARQPGTRPSIDYFDHYKRPPSRDSSVDRYGRRSRQPSVEAAPTTGGMSRGGSVAPTGTSRPTSRAATPAGNGHLTSGRGSLSRASSREQQPFEETLLRKRNLGQEISPSPYQPKRTESLYVAQNPTPPPLLPMGGGGGRKVSFHMNYYNYNFFNI